MRQSCPCISLLLPLIVTTVLTGACLNPIVDPTLSYVLRFNPNGGGLDAPYQADSEFTPVFVGDRVPLPAPGTIHHPTDVFFGWNTRQSGGGTFYVPGETITMLSYDVILYEKWGAGGPAGRCISCDKGLYSEGRSCLEAAPTDSGTGLQNTAHIISVLGGGTYAAELADSQIIAGFTDWFLRSADELHLMYENLHDQMPAVGGFATENYWASTASVDINYALYRSFSTGNSFKTLRSNSMHVRPARRF